MRYLKSYFLFESVYNKSVYNACEELLGDFPLWKRYKKFIDRSVELVIDTESERTAQAHFDVMSSTPERIVIQMSGLPKSIEEKGDLAHELIHVLQHISGNIGDLPFITDATRDVNEISDNPLWERIVYAIYISCPQECEAWEAGNLYHRHKILNDIIPWMEKFNPVNAASELRRIKPEPNQWDIESFDEFPSFWSDAYEGYGEVREDSDITGLREMDLEEFLIHYDKKFKRAASLLS